MLTGTDESELRDAAASIESAGCRAHTQAIDLRKDTAAAMLIEAAHNRFGRLDILVNNAGGSLVPGPSYASSVPEADLRRMLDLNLMGTILCCQAASEPMKEQRSGKIVNVGSQAGLRSNGGGGTAYAVAKAAIQHYTRKLASDLGPYNINVNCLAPAWILSSRAIASGRGSPESRARLEQEIALGRLGTPEDCAKVVEFLTTDLSDYVTGQVISVCGGVCLF